MNVESILNEVKSTYTLQKKLKINDYFGGVASTPANIYDGDICNNSPRFSESPGYSTVFFHVMLLRRFKKITIYFIGVFRTLFNI